MRRFRFVHAADLHLDTPFEGLGRAAPEIADALRDASLDAWDALVDLTLASEAAFLLLAGDIYDGIHRGVRAQIRFLRGLERLAARDVHTFIIHGNHDAIDAWPAIRRWPVGVTLFGAADVLSLPARRGDERLATIHGISFSPELAHENLARRFRRGLEPGLHIGLLHCAVGNDSGDNLYNPCTIDDLLAAGMDYWALGHIHAHSVVGEAGPLAVYSGSLQGRSPKKGELGAKGAMVVESSGGAITSVSFKPLDRARFLTFAIDVSAEPDLASTQSLLVQRTEAARTEHTGRTLVLQATLRGRGVIHRDLLRPGAIEEMLRDLRQHFALDRPRIWWNTITDATGPPLDRDHVRRRGDFSAEIVRRRDGLSAQPAERDAFLGSAFAPLGRLALHPWLPDLTDQDREALLADAEQLALDLLQERDT